MAHNMHDESNESVLVSEWQAKPVKTSSPRASLSALQWAADKAGMSYGRFLQTITHRDEERIQEEYEEFIVEREAAGRRKRRVGNAPTSNGPVTGGFIIGDEDA